MINRFVPVFIAVLGRKLSWYPSQRNVIFDRTPETMKTLPFDVESPLPEGEG